MILKFNFITPVSYNPSEIILIWQFGAQNHFINVENSSREPWYIFITEFCDEWKV